MKTLNSIILDVVSKNSPQDETINDLRELVSLTETVGGIVIKKIIQKRGRPSPKTYLGSGKAFEASEVAKALKTDVIICNTILKPNQIMALKDIFHMEIWDRVDLILNIFDKHAKTDEAFLQIKLARLRHEFPKLYARQAETLFERAGAGIGTRGAGEKGIEDEKRHLRSRIIDLEKKIAEFALVRSNQRKNRKKAGKKSVSLVGYTNAGKSSLLKALTKKDVYIADELFATLDNRIGKLWLQDLHDTVLLSDTIGFIRDLPPFLISSFKATLEEVLESDLILHVIDVSDPAMLNKIDVVLGILDDLGLKKPRILNVFNKVDMVKRKRIRLPRRKFFKNPIIVSSLTRQGLEELKLRIALEFV